MSKVGLTYFKLLRQWLHYILSSCRASSCRYIWSLYISGTTGMPTLDMDLPILISSAFSTGTSHRTPGQGSELRRNEGKGGTKRMQASRRRIHVLSVWCCSERFCPPVLKPIPLTPLELGKIEKGKSLLCTAKKKFPSPSSSTSIHPYNSSRTAPAAPPFANTAPSQPSSETTTSLAKTGTPGTAP